MRIFAVDTLKKMAQRRGLTCRKVLAYHYKDHHDPDEDLKANENRDLQGARDAMYLFVKETEKDPVTIDGNICYHFSFSIFDEKTGLRTDDEPELRAAIAEPIPTRCFKTMKRLWQNRCSAT